MKVTLSDTARRFIALFEEETEATAHDCLVFDDRVVFLVAAGDMATAIGPGGRTVQSVVRHVTLSRQNDTVAYVEVAEADRGVAIGASGKTIDTARELARRHYDIDDIQLT